MPPSTLTATRPEWITRAEAARITGLTYWEVRTLIRKGQIRARDLPGLRAIYSRADAERIAAAAAPSA